MTSKSSFNQKASSHAQPRSQRERCIKIGITIISIVLITLIILLIIKYFRSRATRTPVLSLEKSIESDFFEQRENFLQKRENLTISLLKKRQEGECYSEDKLGSLGSVESKEESYLDFKAKIGENLTSENTNDSNSFEPFNGSVKSFTLDGRPEDIEDSKTWEKVKKNGKKKKKKFGLKKTKTQIS